MILQNKRGGTIRKLDVFNKQYEMEQIYHTKRNDFVLKAKREVDSTKHAQAEEQKRLIRQKEEALQDLLTNFEKDIEKLSAVSRQYSNKEDYILHFEELE